MSSQRGLWARRTEMQRLLINLMVFFVVWSLRATVFYAVDIHIDSEIARRVYANALTFGLWFVPVYAYLRYVDRINPFRYLKLSTPVPPHRLLYAAIIGVIYVMVLLVNAAALGGDIRALTQASLLESLTVLLSVLFSPFSEEVVFRGFVLPKLAQRYPFWGANIVSALLFSAMHLPHWLWMRGLQPSVLRDVVSVFATGCVLGYLRNRSQSLWPCIVLHVINNYVVAIISSG